MTIIYLILINEVLMIYIYVLHYQRKKIYFARKSVQKMLLDIQLVKPKNGSITAVIVK